MTDWCHESARAIAGAVASGRARAEDVAAAHLARIRDLDERLGCYLCVDEAGALAQARAVDAAVAEGRSVGPLAGVPVGLKDLLVTAGLPTTAGSRILEGWRPPYDGTVVARLRAAGAVILGKLNLDEFAMGSSNETSAYRTCRNPWDPSRVPGGSSGGSAAAVSAGLCTLAMGTDTGGSVRQPAALCGCVGLRPTYGRVSRYGVVAYASSLDQVGPLGRSVADCGLALSVIAGHDPLDATSIPGPVPAYRAEPGDLAGLRVGVVPAMAGEGLDPEVGAAVARAVGDLERLGARVVEVALPSTAHAIAAYYLIATAEASSNLARYDGVRYGRRVSSDDLAEMYARTRAEGFGPEVKRRILLGTYALRAGYYDAYYLRAQKVRTLVRRDFEKAFGVCDVIAGPTSPVTAFRLGERTADPLAMYLADVYTIPGPLAGLPGISVPCGLSPDRLPIGLQLVGPALSEPLLLRVAAAYEAATPHVQLRPPLGGVS